MIPTAVESYPADPTASDSSVLSLTAQSEAELAQEQALVTRSLFVHLLPDSADHALSGVSGLTVPEVAGGSKPPAAQALTSESMVAAAAVPVFSPSQPDYAIEMPDVVTLPVIVSDDPVVEEAPEAVPLVTASVHALPLPAIPLMDAIELLDVPVQEAPPTEVPVVAALVPTPQSGKPDHRSQAMLAEIGFLDEETPEP